MDRYLKAAVWEDLREKMVFLGGPRQVGKTTFALNLLAHGDETHPAYLSWDNLAAKRALLQGALPSDEKLIILDEIHKYKGWRMTSGSCFNLVDFPNRFSRGMPATGSDGSGSVRAG